MLGASCTRCQQLGGGRMLAVAVAVLATFTFPRLARGAKDDTMRVSWSPQAAECQQDETGLKEYLNSHYYYRGETVDGKGYYSRNIDSATLNGKQYEMYLFVESYWDPPAKPAGLDRWFVACGRPDGRPDFESDNSHDFYRLETLTITAGHSGGGEEAAAATAMQIDTSNEVVYLTPVARNPEYNYAPQPKSNIIYAI
eukprot:gene12821-11697_t